jgi:hypothetical protein
VWALERDWELAARSLFIQPGAPVLANGCFDCRVEKWAAVALLGQRSESSKSSTHNASGGGRGNVSKGEHTQSI